MFNKDICKSSPKPISPQSCSKHLLITPVIFAVVQQLQPSHKE